MNAAELFLYLAAHQCLLEPSDVVQRDCKALDRHEELEDLYRDNLGHIWSFCRAKRGQGCPIFILLLMTITCISTHTHRGLCGLERAWQKLFHLHFACVPLHPGSSPAARLRTLGSNGDAPHRVLRGEMEDHTTGSSLVLSYHVLWYQHSAHHTIPCSLLFLPNLLFPIPCFFQDPALPLVSSPLFSSLTLPYCCCLSFISSRPSTYLHLHLSSDSVVFL